ncbi:MAG: respiratory nitrate reductase subunit gamma, partial [Acidimicrobiia bacterium]|nr:respiratory nitrate reductase subunit gamma [Acidimicrobiia bacterium]
MNSRRVLPKPHQIVLGIGVLAAVGTLASGIAPEITGWHDKSSIAREVFVNIPAPLEVAFYLAVATGLFLTAWLTSLRVRNYERGKPDNRRTNKGNVHRRMRDFRRGVWMRTLLRDPAAGVMHSMIYFGFLVLFIVTILLEVDHQLPDSLKFLHGRTYQAYAFTADLFGLVFLGGIVWAFVRRYAQQPYRIRIKTKPEHLVILVTFLVIGVTGFITEGFRIAALRNELGAGADFEKWSFVGWATSNVVHNWSTSTLLDAHRWAWSAHVIAFLGFLVILPTTMLRHMITSPMNMYLKDRERPKGAMREMPNLMETELETFGASTIEDFTWKQLFDTDACTICGRCTSVCPAHATGKPLDPREIVNKTGEVMALTGTP